jgi:ribosomal protein S18 acetylase RimI-like enzyme
MAGTSRHNAVVIPRGGERPTSLDWSQVRHWPGDHRRLVITRGSRRSSPARLDILVRNAAENGYIEVLTGAVDLLEADRYLRHGFAVRSELVVLERPSGAPVVNPTNDHHPLANHRASRWVRPQLEMIDRQAFGPFWHLDAAAIAEAQRATARSFTRIVHHDGSPVAYALWGLGGDVGYLQRLAVIPEMWGQGIASSLITSGLARLDRRVRRVLVNTETTNNRALELYQRHGFSLTPWRLQVLGRTLDTPITPLR